MERTTKYCWVVAAFTFLVALVAFLWWLLHGRTTSDASNIAQVVELPITILALVVPGLAIVLGIRERIAESRTVPIAVIIVTLLLAGVLVGAQRVRGPGAPPSCPSASGDQAGRRDGQLVFGALLPKTGVLQSEGRQVEAAVELAVQDVRNAGGAAGIAVAPFDEADFADEGEPDTDAVCSALNTLISHDGQPSDVDAIIGPMASSSLLRAVGRVNAAHGIMISPAATAPEVEGAEDTGAVFRTVPTDLLQGRVLGDLVVGEGQPGEKVAVVARDDQYGTALQHEVQSEISGFGGRVVQTFGYDPTAPDARRYQQVLAGLDAFRPAAIALIGYDEVGGLVQDMGAHDLTASTVRMYGTDGFLDQGFPSKVVGPPVAGIRGTVPYVDPGLASRLRATSGGDDFLYTAQAYDAVVITALAAAATGSDDPMVLRSAIDDVTRGGPGAQQCGSYAACLDILRTDPHADIDYNGLSGPLDFIGSGEPCQGRYSIVRFTPQNTLEEYAQATGAYLCTQTVSETPRPLYPTPPG